MAQLEHEIGAEGEAVAVLVLRVEGLAQRVQQTGAVTNGRDAHHRVAGWPS